MKAKSTLIIAEAGVNHNGDLDMALRLIDAAAEAGADLVKFQTYSAQRLAVRDAKKAAYQQAQTGVGETQYEMLQRLELSPQNHQILIDHCTHRGIGFFSTGFDTQSVDLLVSLGQDMFKIPSGEITNLPYLRHIGGLRKNVILSTGMATLGEIEAALEVLEVSGTPRDQIVVLHCTTEYPAPFEEVNLRVMPALAQSLGVKVGYSDHTRGIDVAIAAVALGATIIEKHFTLDRTLPGPDHAASLEPGELAGMVAAIRNVEKALGDTVKRRTASEIGNVAVARKSIVAARPIRQGETYSADNLATKRPGTGISPMRWDEMLGRAAQRDYQADELIEP
ncbi:N-acetylneuraminate synthase [Laribacter hongkongensis]|uniref:N-acetylneuraminate synthase n=1 Tax=Laribacter hongkongensis TaxID=168471 RepID=UPI001EFEE147|nr:N-acetylneuraminate synthase [Laribacter hongkongensis]MCG8995494.1 N-acetylneuraminate synthase [Laribacter hongkongensis]MCG9010311.1 N-acetylneuraminate synthase [Laribacter hongkongensis]MCG9046205.1 N-acetylneuraminate synthase [Laribacter hongkongensis]MCG9051746.1 N-acetylneuraminate synthase [Laribacter hongkongensis]MCG9073777.1 N-acetylneuraminate synthase [Laribacter hongkongensis]